MSDQYLVISYGYRNIGFPLSMELIRAIKNPIFLNKDYSMRKFTEIQIEEEEFTIRILNDSDIIPVTQGKEYLLKEKEKRIEYLKSELERLQFPDAL